MGGGGKRGWGFLLQSCWNALALGVVVAQGVRALNAPDLPTHKRLICVTSSLSSGSRCTR